MTNSRTWRPDGRLVRALRRLQSRVDTNAAAAIQGGGRRSKGGTSTNFWWRWGHRLDISSRIRQDSACLVAGRAGDDRGVARRPSRSRRRRPRALRARRVAQSVGLIPAALRPCAATSRGGPTSRADVQRVAARRGHPLAGLRASDSETESPHSRLCERDEWRPGCGRRQNQRRGEGSPVDRARECSSRIVAEARRPPDLKLRPTDPMRVSQTSSVDKRVRRIDLRLLGNADFLQDRH